MLGVDEHWTVEGAFRHRGEVQPAIPQRASVPGGNAHVVLAQTLSRPAPSPGPRGAWPARRAGRPSWTSASVVRFSSATTVISMPRILPYRASAGRSVASRCAAGSSLRSSWCGRGPPSPDRSSRASPEGPDVVGGHAGRGPHVHPVRSYAGGRTQVVFGVGDPRADLLFVGEGPGGGGTGRGNHSSGARAGSSTSWCSTRWVSPVTGSTSPTWSSAARPGTGIPSRRRSTPATRGSRRSSSTSIKSPSPSAGSPPRRLLGTKESMSALRGRGHPFRNGVCIPHSTPRTCCAVALGPWRRCGPISCGRSWL